MLVRKMMCKKYMIVVKDSIDLFEGKAKLEHGKGSNQKAKLVAQQRKGPIDLFMIKKPNVKDARLRQTNINDAYAKEARNKTIQHNARFFHQAGIAFNAANLDIFKAMIEAIERHGPNLKPPHFHELRVPFLKRKSAYTEDTQGS